MSVRFGIKTKSRRINSILDRLSWLLFAGTGVERGNIHLTKRLRDWCWLWFEVGWRFGLGHADAEDVIDVADDGAALTVGKFAIGVIQLFDFGAGLDAGIAIFLVAEGFTRNARENGEQARVGFGLFFD